METENIGNAMAKSENGLIAYTQVDVNGDTELSNLRFPNEDNLVSFIRGRIFDQDGWLGMGRPEDNTLCDKCEVELPDGTSLSYIPRVTVVVPGLAFVNIEADKAIVEFASDQGGNMLGMVIGFARMRGWHLLRDYRLSGKGDAASALRTSDHILYYEPYLAWKVTDKVYGDRFRRLAHDMHASAMKYASSPPRKPARFVYGAPCFIREGEYISRERVERKGE